jgi:hypothetical protein
MNKHLAETFDLPEYSQPSDADINAALENAQDLEKSFKDINSFDAHDVEMDEISEMAVSAHRDLLLVV